MPGGGFVALLNFTWGADGGGGAVDEEVIGVGG